MTTTSRTTNTSSRRINARRLGLRESIDLPLLVIVITLFAIGLLMIYSASWQYASVQGFSEYRTVLRQFAIGLVGFALIGLLTFIDYREYERFVVLGMVVIIALSLLVLIAGTETQFGARRGLLGGSIQPSEFAKLAIIIYLSFWLNNKSDSLHKTTYGLFPLLAIVGGTAGLVLMQPDISAAATIVFLGGLMFYIAGGKMSQILAVVLATGFSVSSWQNSAQQLPPASPTTGTGCKTRKQHLITSSGRWKPLLTAAFLVSASVDLPPNSLGCRWQPQTRYSQ